MSFCIVWPQLKFLDFANKCSLNAHLHNNNNQSNIWDVNASETVRAGVKMPAIIFVEVDIFHLLHPCACWNLWPWSKPSRSSICTFLDHSVCHRLENFANVVLRYFDLHFQGQACSCYVSANKNRAMTVDVPGRCASPRIALAVELLLLSSSYENSTALYNQLRQMVFLALFLHIWLIHLCTLFMSVTKNVIIIHIYIYIYIYVVNILVCISIILTILFTLRMEGRTCVPTCGRTTDRRKNVWTVGRTDGCTDRRTDGQTDPRTDGQTVGQTDSRSDGWRWTD